MPSSEDVRKLVFMNYKEIISDFNYRGLTTKGGKPITHTDLRKAIQVMQKSIRYADGEVKKLNKDITIVNTRVLYG